MGKTNKVDGYSLVYERWSKIMGGNGVSGTIRTRPENYYVATVTEEGELVFEDLEVNTKNINKIKVTKFFSTH